MAATRTRLAPEERRAQLLRIGASLFASQPYELVGIEEIADLAGVSRGLMYRYFATKREFFREVVQAASERLLDLTDVDPARPVAERVSAGVDAFLQYYEQNADGVRAAHRGSASTDDEVRAVIVRSYDLHEARILEAFAGEDITVTPALRVAVRGWLHMLRALGIDWLENPTLTREQLRDLCTRCLLDMVAAVR